MAPRPKRKLKSKERHQVSALVRLLLVCAICLFTGGLSYPDSMDAPFCRGDLDSDGDVDGADLVVFAEDYGWTNCPCQQVKVVKPGESIQLVIDSIKDASADKPYIVVLPPGVYVESAKIALPRYIDLIGAGKTMSQLWPTSDITEAVIELNYEEMRIKDLLIRSSYCNQVVDQILIKYCRNSVIEHVKLRSGRGSGIAIDHPAQLVSKCLWIRDFHMMGFWESAIRNKGIGYARVYIDGGHITTWVAKPEAHGIEGNFIGSIKNIHMIGVGGNHVRIIDSQKGLTISDCHFEQPVSGTSIYLKNCNKVTVRNITIWSIPDYPLDYAVYLENCQDCIVESCYVGVNSASANHVSFYADANSKNNTFRNNRVVGLTGNKKKYDVSAGNTIIDNGEIVQAWVESLQHWSYSELDSSGGAITASLPDGSYIGETKTIGMVDATHPSTVTVTHLVAADGGDGTVGNF